MANLSVRKLDEEVFSKLRLRAATHGVSMEEEVRHILKQAVANPIRLGDMTVQLFGEKQGIELEWPEHMPHEPLDLLLWWFWILMSFQKSYALTQARLLSHG